MDRFFTLAGHGPRALAIAAVGAVGLALGGCGMSQSGDDSSPMGGASTTPVGGGDRPISSDGADLRRPIAADGISGTVRDTSGRPVAGVLVEALAEPGSPPAPDLAVVTDGQGRFAWPLRSGTYQLKAGARGIPVTVTARVGSLVTVDLIAR